MKIFRSSLSAALALALAAPLAAQQTLNVRDADIRAFIQDAARVTGRTFIIDNRVTGKVSVVTDRPLSTSEYFEVFLSTLRANGLVAIPTGGGAYRIQPVEGAAGQAGAVGRAANRNAFVTEVFRLRNVDATSTLETLRPLVSKDGSVTANRAGNSIVVADYADNVSRIRQLIRRLDQSNDATQVIALKNASAREIATSLTGLAPANSQGGPTATAVAIDSANAVAIRGDPATVARLASVARELDTKAKSGTEIRVVFLENADAAQLLPVLQQLVGQTPDSIPESTLSRSNFGQSNTNATGTNTNLVSTQPTQQQQSAAAPGGGGNGQVALTTQGGRTAAVVTRFAGANAIIIAAPPDIQRQLAEVVRQLDTRREQVLVEAIVAEVSDSTINRLGAQFLLGNTKGGAFAASTFSNSQPNILQIGAAIAARELSTNTTTVVGADGTRTTTTTSPAGSDQLTQSAVQSLLSTSGGFAGFGGQVGSTIFGAIINAVKSDNTSNLLQVPHVLTLDNTEARLLSGQEIPITTGQALSSNFDNAFRTTQRENVGIQLEVKPQINSSGSIKLFIHQQVSSIAGPVATDNSDLILNKREVETTLTVDDGEIAVIGGLLSDEERRTFEKIPLLGDIPVLGALFRSKAKERAKTNLMVFIRPTILRSPEDSRRLTEQRYGYLRAQQMSGNPRGEPSIDTLVREYLDTIPPGATPLPADPTANATVVGPPGAPVVVTPPPGRPAVIEVPVTTTSTVITPASPPRRNRK